MSTVTHHIPEIVLKYLHSQFVRQNGTKGVKKISHLYCTTDRYLIFLLFYQPNMT